MLMIFLALASLAVVIRFLRRARVHGPLLPVSNARALFLWGERFDAEFPADSEARLALQARGAIAKRRLIAHLQNRAVIREREDAKRERKEPQLLNAVHRIADGPLLPLRLNIVPLASLLPSQPGVPIIVRRPRLSLAR